MLNFVPFLLGWAEGWISSGKTAPTLSSVQGDTSRPKTSAWLVVEGLEVAGQITVWDTGECDLEAFDIETGVPKLQETRTVASFEELASAIRLVVAICE